jgi:hypothetical protein
VPFIAAALRSWKNGLLNQQKSLKHMLNKFTSYINRQYFPLTAALTAAVAAAVVLGGCSSVKTQVAKAPINARSFSFIQINSRTPPSYADDRQQVHAMVQQAIANTLAGKGVSHVPTGGDVTVAYLIIAGNNAATASLNTYFGYTEDAQALASQVHKEQTDSSPNRGYFESGTLVIDFVDPKTSTLLQRRTIQAPILRNLSVEQRTARLQSIVDDALKGVPIVH